VVGHEKWRPRPLYLIRDGGMFNDRIIIERLSVRKGMFNRDIFDVDTIEKIKK